MMMSGAWPFGALVAQQQAEMQDAHTLPVHAYIAFMYPFIYILNLCFFFSTLVEIYMSLIVGF